MTKIDVLSWFGGSVLKAARALGYTHQAIYLWPDDEDLPQATQDRIVGAMTRAGRWPVTEAPATEAQRA